jgi:hypothetical protein
MRQTLAAKHGVVLENQSVLDGRHLSPDLSSRPSGLVGFEIASKPILAALQKTWRAGRQKR